MLYSIIGTVIYTKIRYIHTLNSLSTCTLSDLHMGQAFFCRTRSFLNDDKVPMSSLKKSTHPLRCFNNLICNKQRQSPLFLFNSPPLLYATLSYFNFPSLIYLLLLLTTFTLDRSFSSLPFDLLTLLFCEGHMACVAFTNILLIFSILSHIASHTFVSKGSISDIFR